eukprot:COSAG02_NODE_139_length_34376_cov_233.853663_8_plen_89_part_00
MALSHHHASQLFTMFRRLDTKARSGWEISSFFWCLLWPRPINNHQLMCSTFAKRDWLCIGWGAWWYADCEYWNSLTAPTAAGIHTRGP